MGLQFMESVKKEPSRASKMTVKDLYEQYMDDKKSEIRATTWDKSRRNLEYYILPSLGDVKLSKLNASRLQQWKNDIGGMELSTVTKQNVYRELSAMMNYAVRMELITKTPLSGVGTFREPNFEKPEEKLHYYTPEQYRRFIAEAKKDADRRYYVFFSIAFYTGMRKGEINALRWTDIEGNIIHVRRSVTQKLKGDDVETPPKNKSSYRNLQMPKNLMDILDEHKSILISNGIYREENRICGGERCLRDSSIEHKNTLYANAAGLPHIRIHDFRHTHASVLINEWISIQEIARRLGHSKVEITWNTYAHLYPREEERAVRILERI